MFVVNDDRSIYLTRGDTVFFRVTAKDHGTPYTFKPGDIVRMSVTAKKDVSTVYLQKDFPVYKATKSVFIYLEEMDTKIGKKANKHEDFWYEIVLNPDTRPQTVIGYDDDGPKIFRVFPDADEIDPAVPEPEEIPVVDAELDLTSYRPVSNHAVAVAVAKLTAAVEELKGAMPEEETPAGSVFNAAGQVEGLSIVTIDAYGVAVRNGYEGTEEEWLASLQGIQGIPGAPGYTPQKYIDYWTEEDKTEMMGSFKVLTDSEIELLNAMLTEDTLISNPAMVASYTAGYRDPVEPGGLRQHYCDVTATITNISRALIAKAEVGWKVSTGSIVDVWEWHDAEITFGDTEHTVSYTQVSEYVQPYKGLAVKLTYFSLIGGENELIAEAVNNG